MKLINMNTFPEKLEFLPALKSCKYLIQNGTTIMEKVWICYFIHNSYKLQMN